MEAQMTDAQLEKYKKVKTRIMELESEITDLENQIPCKSVRVRLEMTKLLLKTNTDILYFWFGENQLKH